MTAFALSTVFAACTQDTELNETIAKNDFSNIPMVEAEFTVNTGVDSRMATKFGWEVGDKVGFAWLGDGTTITGNTTGLAYQNHPLFCTDASNASFKTETMLYVGQYFAYLPYTEGTKSIENIEFTLEDQPLATNSNDLAPMAIYIAPKKTTLTNASTVPVGQHEAGMGKNLPLNISMLSNAATLEFTFKNTEELADLKVLGIKIDVKNNAYTYAASSYTKTPGASSLPTSFSYNPKEYASINAWNQMDASAVRDFYDDSDGSVAAVPTCNGVELTSEAGLALTEGKLNTYALILPVNKALTITPAPSTPGDYTTDELEITAVTNYGNIAATNIKIDGEAFAATTELFTKFGQTGKITAEFDAEKNTSYENGTVTSQAELEELLASMAATGAEDEVTITLDFATAPSTATAFTLTDFTLPEGLKADVTLAKGSNPSKIVFAGETVINYPLTIDEATVQGTMTVNNIEVDDTQVASLTGTTITLDNGAVLKNNGWIAATVETKAAVLSPAKALSLYVSNGEDAKVTAITNNGEVQWIAGTLPVGVSGVVFAEVTDFVSLKNVGTGVTTARFVSEVEFNNGNASIELTGGIATIECYEPVTININKHSINGVNDVDFGGLTKIDIKEGAALNIVSDDKDNTVTTTSTLDIYVAKNSQLNVTLVGLASQWDVEYAGAVTMNQVTGTAPNKNKVSGSNGTWSATE